ncbi:MAG: GEVED domain-containing protein [Acidimicrobiales bacterium]
MRKRTLASVVLVGALVLSGGALAQAAPDAPSAPPPAQAPPGPSNVAQPRRPLVVTPLPGGIVAQGLSFETTRLFGSPGGSNVVVPDTMGSVGPNHIVELINGNMQIFDKNTGASVEDRSLDSFWTDRVGVPAPSAGRYFDPRIAFDPASQRWFALSIDDDNAPTAANSLVIGRSDTADPTGDWDGLQLDSDTVAPEEFHDYPTLGIDADGVYSCTQDFEGPGNETCYSFPKSDLLLAVPSAANMTRFEATPAGLIAVSGSYQPALDFGASDGRAPLLASTGTALTRSSIVGAGAAGATLTGPVAIGGDPGHAAPPDARQPNDGAGELERIENVAPRLVANVFEQGNSLWAVHSVAGTGGNAALRWYNINETTNAIIQTGLINDTTRDFIDPSIAANAHGDVVIGYTCSGPSQAASVCASFGTTSGGTTTFQAPLVLTAGNGFYFRDGGTDRNRWGDYSATVIDPSDPCTFWTFQEFTAVTGTGDVGPTENVESGLYGIQAIELTFAGCLADAGLRDFGDAPDTYGTTLAANGARHIPSFAAPFLGTEIDFEANGLPTAGMTGDDTNATDDEDGVTLPPGLPVGLNASTTVTASGAGGRLDAFVDFNRNGVFTDAGEKVANNLVLAAGPNNVTFAVPLLATPGPSAARFRISSAGGLGPTGQAANGEVEDYAVMIVGLEEFCAGPPPPGAIVGTAGNDIPIVGTAGNDVIFGLGGHDEIRGLGGNDVICGGDGRDWLQGGDGNDGLVGGADVDKLEGGGNDDVMYGGTGIDRLDGGPGNDTMFGGAGIDRLDGNEGTNTNDGGPDTDFCINPQAGAVNCELP